MNHLATKIQSMHYKLINLYANPEPEHKNDPTKYYCPIPQMKKKEAKFETIYYNFTTTLSFTNNGNYG